MADLHIDPAAGTVSREGQPLALSELSVRVLTALAEAFPHPLGSEALAAKAWDQPFVSDQTLMQRIAMIRRELDDDPARPRYVRTVRNKGYALAAEPKLEQSELRPPADRRITSVVIAALLLAGLLAILLYADRSVVTPPVLFDKYRQALRIDDLRASLDRPIQVEADGVDILVAGLPDPAIVTRHPDALRTLCSLANGRGNYASAPSQQFLDWLKAIEASCNFQYSKGAAVDTETSTK